MGFLELFMATGNPELSSITLDLPVHGSGPDSVAGTTLTDPIKVIDIGNNAKLTQVSLSAGLEEGRFVAIYDNPSLTSVSLGTLNDLEELNISGNDVLTSIDVGALETVDTLSVINNPQLDTAQLAGLRTFEARLLGNAQPPASP